MTVNGETRVCRPDLTVDLVVEAMTGRRRGVAVAVNGEVVPRTRWAGTALVDGDRVEVLTAAQGG